MHPTPSAPGRGNPPRSRPVASRACRDCPSTVRLRERGVANLVGIGHFQVVTTFPLDCQSIIPDQILKPRGLFLSGNLAHNNHIFIHNCVGLRASEIVFRISTWPRHRKISVTESVQSVIHATDGRGQPVKIWRRATSRTGKTPTSSTTAILLRCRDYLCWHVS